MEKGQIVTLLHWLAANLMDTVSTLVGFQRGHVEANLVPAWLLQLHGPVYLMAWKWMWVALVPLAIYFLRRRWKLWPALRIGTLLAYAVVFLNYLTLLGLLKLPIGY